MAFRGPYIRSESDPWGNAYLITAHALTRSETDHGYVISAGPNGVLETDRTQVPTAAFVIGGDDIVQRVQ